jgi:hypothetical protein
VAKFYGDRIKKISLERLIEGFPLYFRTARNISEEPSEVPDNLNVATTDKEQFWKAIDFLTYGLAIAFALLIPAFILYQEKVSKLTFLIRFLTIFFLFGLLLHYALIVFGARGTKSDRTYTVYAYLVGLSAPLYILLSYPLFLTFGPAAVFGSEVDPKRIPPFFREHLAAVGIYSGIVRVIFVIASVAILLAWFSKSHNINKIRVFLALGLSAFINLIILRIIITPFFNKIFVYVDKFLAYL